MPVTIALSEAAVAVLRFRIKGYRMPVIAERLPAFEELVAAGVMESDGEGDYRFADDDPARREELLRQQEDRIERERYAPPDASRLSDAARERLRRHLAGDDRVTDATRPAYRELAAARVMIPVSGFATGSESRFVFTYWGDKLRFELAGMAGADEDGR